jgi:hypothetical protein
MYHIGVGATQVNNFLSTLNFPTVNAKTLRRRCEEVGEELLNLAHQSVQSAWKEEFQCSVAGMNKYIEI